MITETHRLLDTLEIIDTREVGSESYEVCASGTAVFNEDKAQLDMELNSFIRRFEIRGKDEMFHPPWLPKSDRVRMRVSFNDAREAAKEIFANWVKRVRASTPGASKWTPNASWLARGRQQINRRINLYENESAQPRQTREQSGTSGEARISLRQSSSNNAG
jgi:hypothetical protein